MFNLSNLEYLVISFLFLVGINSLISCICSFSSLNIFEKTKSYSKAINKIKIYDNAILMPFILISSAIYILTSYFLFLSILKVSDYFITLAILLGFVLTLLTTFISRLPYCYACNVLLKTKFSEKECFMENLFNLLNIFFPLFFLSFVISSISLLPFKESINLILIGVFIFLYLLLELSLVSQKKITRLKAKRIKNEDIVNTLDYLFEMNNIKKYKLYYWDSSRSNEDNAFVTGVFTHYVFISTTLIDKLTLKELEAVILHELGHIKNHHLLKKFIFEGVLLLSIGIIFYLLLLFNKLNIWIIFGLLFIFTFIIGVDLRIGKKKEEEADLFVNSKGYGKELISALKKLSYDGELEQDKASSSHPSLKKRINNLDEK